MDWLFGTSLYPAERIVTLMRSYARCFPASSRMLAVTPTTTVSRWLV